MTEWTYNLQLDVRPKGSAVVNGSITIVGDDLVNVLSRFQIQLVQLINKLKEEEKYDRVDDDIPF